MSGNNGKGDKSMWSAILQTINEGFKTLRSLFGKSQTTEPTQKPIDAQAAREGTESGAAATHAGRITGHEKR